MVPSGVLDPILHLNTAAWARSADKCMGKKGCKGRQGTMHKCISVLSKPLEMRQRGVRSSIRVTESLDVKSNDFYQGTNGNGSSCKRVSLAAREREDVQPVCKRVGTDYHDKTTPPRATEWLSSLLCLPTHPATRIIGVEPRLASGEAPQTMMPRRLV